MTDEVRKAKWLRDAEAVGRELVRLYDEAIALGDVHEARHLHAALVAGDSDPCTPGRCALDPAFQMSSRYGVVAT